MGSWRYSAAMCGIAGFADRSTSPEESRAVIGAMTAAIRNRGPDDSGFWFERHFGLAFGHRRLSILDLSSKGRQPMHSESHRYVIIFNGEIYNFKILLNELRGLGHHFRGHSDTEVMLAAFEQWGVSAAVEKFVGMFAFAVWDKKDDLLSLARDRMGEKPLYYGWSGGTFFFGSELKALTAHPKCEAEIDRNALAALLRYGYVPSPGSIYHNFYKLTPGSILSLKPQHFTRRPEEFSPEPGERASSTRPIRYWSVEKAASRGIDSPFLGTEEEAALELEELLRDAVGIQMTADVPLGAFLSGGIDSSLIVALMQAQSPRPIRTFSIGFNEKEYNEAVYAKAVARHLGTDHTELYLESTDALNVIPLLPNMFDEPFADSSQIPTYLVSKLCSQNVRVSLSGDGGDELFAGYSRYFWARNAWAALRLLPHNLRSSLGESIHAIAPETYERWFRRIDFLLPHRLRVLTTAGKMRTIGRVLKFRDKHQLYKGLMSQWDSPEQFVIGSKPLVSPDDRDEFPEMPNFLSEMMFSDMVSYLPDDILVKVDRASMAVSLEARAPFLDHRVVEFAWRLPIEFKVGGGITKKILRKILHRHVPKELVERPKMGFSVPLDRWLRGELRDWAEDLLDPQKLKEQGFFHPEPIRQKWKEHLSGAHRWENHLWSVLMFQAWQEEHKDQQVRVRESLKEERNVPLFPFLNAPSSNP